MRVCEAKIRRYVRHQHLIRSEIKSTKLCVCITKVKYNRCCPTSFPFKQLRTSKRNQQNKKINIAPTIIFCIIFLFPFTFSHRNNFNLWFLVLEVLEQKKRRKHLHTEYTTIPTTIRKQFTKFITHKISRNAHIEILKSLIRSYLYCVSNVAVNCLLYLFFYQFIPALILSYKKYIHCS